MVHNKPPIIDGLQPKAEERYDLDQKSNWQFLNVAFREHEPIADEYDHYPHCKWAIVEYKSCSLKNAVEQLENTAKQLIEANRHVDHAIIILEKFDGKERDLYKKNGNTLIIKNKRVPASIRLNDKSIIVKVYEPHEIDRQYKDYKGSLPRWQST